MAAVERAYLDGVDAARRATMAAGLGITAADVEAAAVYLVRQKQLARLDTWSSTERRWRR